MVQKGLEKELKRNSTHALWVLFYVLDRTEKAWYTKNEKNCGGSKAWETDRLMKRIARDIGPYWEL
jgi:hypothetical protein